MNFKKIVTELMPFGGLKYILNVRYEKGSVIKLDRSLPEISECESKFKNIVSVQGFGFSGSGAVVDFLREFSCCLVLGTIDNEGSVAKGNRLVNGEIDFLRHSGGLFEFEKYLDDNNLFTKDALVKRFVRLVNTTSLFDDEQMKLLVNQFYNQVIEFEIDTKGHNDYNWHLSNPLCPDANIKVMRQMSLQGYRELCRRFLTLLFNHFKDEKHSILVLDQLCNDFNFEYDRYLSYIPNLKLIFVYRDPRDTYAYALTKRVPWIPHDNVDDFIKWYNINKKSLKIDSTDYLVVRFEDLVIDYEETTTLVMQYLDLNVEKHSLPFNCFNPNESAKNIGIWKRFPQYRSDMDLILKSFPDFCYKAK